MGTPPRVIRLSSLALNSKEGALECDTHTDTSVLGRGTLIIQDFQRPVMVEGYDPSMGSHVYPTVSGVLGYIHPFSLQRYHLIVHQGISVPHLDHHLCCPMQSRMNDVIINDVPKFLLKNPSPDDHAFVVPDPDYPDDPDKTLTLPLLLKGVTSYLPTETVTMEEYESGEYPRIELTSEHQVWEPNSTRFQEQEEAHMSTW